MTPDQERHLQSIKTYFEAASDAKYRAGQAEHGGDLFAMSVASLLDNAIEEALDLFIYLVSLKQKAIGDCHCHVRRSEF